MKALLLVVSILTVSACSITAATPSRVVPLEADECVMQGGRPIKDNLCRLPKKD